jgi:hypothetical protein
MNLARAFYRSRGRGMLRGVRARGECQRGYVTHTHTHTYIYIHTRTHIYTHTHTNTLTHTNTHTHIHTQVCDAEVV